MKPNKNKFQVGGYRPISLINNISKILEKVANSRLIWYTEYRKNKLPINIPKRVLEK